MGKRGGSEKDGDWGEDLTTACPKFRALAGLQCREPFPCDLPVNGRAMRGIRRAIQNAGPSLMSLANL